VTASSQMTVAKGTPSLHEGNSDDVSLQFERDVLALPSHSESTREPLRNAEIETEGGKWRGRTTRLTSDLTKRLYIKFSLSYVLSTYSLTYLVMCRCQTELLAKILVLRYYLYFRFMFRFRRIVIIIIISGKLTCQF
jgi:hypothetical protein